MSITVKLSVSWDETRTNKKALRSTNGNRIISEVCRSKNYITEEVVELEMRWKMEMDVPAGFSVHKLNRSQTNNRFHWTSIQSLIVDRMSTWKWRNIRFFFFLSKNFTIFGFANLNQSLAFFHPNCRLFFSILRFLYYHFNFGDVICTWVFLKANSSF